MRAGSELPSRLEVLAFGAAFALLACGLFAAGSSRRVIDRRPVLETGSGGVRESVLRDAIQGQLDRDEDPPGEVPWIYQWRPRPGLDVLVWITCRGADLRRACLIATARLEPNDAGPTRLRVLNWEGVGSSVPRIGETADRSTLVLQGQEGRGFWQQLVRYVDDNRGNTVYSRRGFLDGVP